MEHQLHLCGPHYTKPQLCKVIKYKNKINAVKKKERQKNKKYFKSMPADSWSYLLSTFCIIIFLLVLVFPVDLPFLCPLSIMFLALSTLFCPYRHGYILASFVN